MVITGGYKAGPSPVVSVYTEAGHETDLPSLLIGRYHHACAQFSSQDGSKVGSSDLG